MRKCVLLCGVLALLVPMVALAQGGDRALVSFEKGEDLSDWRGGTVVARHASAGACSYLVPAGATATAHLTGDWSPYRHLKFDVYNPGEVVMIDIRVADAQGRSMTAFEYNVYAGRTTQHVRLDGLRNDFTLGEGIDTSRVARVEVAVRARYRYDTCREGLYLDSLRLSTQPTEPYAAAPLVPMKTPPGFTLPEFPGFEAGYNTWASDPAPFQLLARPGTGRDGKGRALEFKPLDTEAITIWDGERAFPQAGAYLVSYWVKGPSGAVCVDYASHRRTPLTPRWQHVTYELPLAAGETQRFVQGLEQLGGRSAWLDDFTVSLKGGTGNLEEVSHAAGPPTTVTWADGICYVNGKPTFILGFMRARPEKLRGTPFNYCFPAELAQPDMRFLDTCAEYGLLTSVNLTGVTRALAPEAAGWFAKKYRNHPALFSYYLCDEPDHASPAACAEPPVLARAREEIRKLDPAHPTQATIIPWCSSNLYSFRDVLDISGGDCYVVRGTPDNADLWEVWRANEALHRSALDGEVNIFIPRASSDITREENWAQAYMCLVGGAGGILWYEFEGAQAKWDDFLALGKELRSLEPFLTGVELEKGLTFARDNGQLRGIGRATATQTALITVNLKPQAANATITAPFLAHAREATVLFEGRTVPVVDGVIVDSFKGLERHVYVVEGVPAGVTPRPVPAVGGPHVTEAGKAWRLDTAGPVRGRAAEEVARERDKAEQLAQAEAALQRGDRVAARAIYEALLRRYPDAQDIHERLRSMPQ